MSDPFANVRPDLASQVYSRSFAITPGSALPYSTRAIFVPYGGGVVTLLTVDDGNSAALAFGPAFVGGLLPIRASAVASWTGGGTLYGFA